MLNNLEEILLWLKNKKRNTTVNIEKIRFSEMVDWDFNPQTGNIEHKTKKFFSITGIDVKTNFGSAIRQWRQPIIEQPEIGILGIISRRVDNETYYLMQAKIEPGNINYVQLSPTLQATKSNYQKVHKGKSPAHLDYFLAENKNIILDQLQSEQGARFLKKRNRNIIIEINDYIDEDEDYKWLTLEQINQLMNYDNFVNMDTRTVISSLIKSDIKELNNDKPLNDFDSIIRWMTYLKTKYELEVNKVYLKDTKDWIISDKSIYHIKNKYFEIIPVKVEIEGREVNSWTQPMIKSKQKGLCCLIIKIINGQIHILIQGKVECGNFDIIEMAPTVQCLTDNYILNRDSLPFLDYTLNADSDNIIYDALQSEEGGRFYNEENRNVIILADESFEIKTPKNFIWLTLLQVQKLLKFNNFFNVQVRSLISALVTRENEIS